jgi:hypothetical protein
VIISCLSPEMCPGIPDGLFFLLIKRSCLFKLKLKVLITVDVIKLN